MPKIDADVFAARMETYRNALLRFEEALRLPKDEGRTYLDVSAHRFMFCYELTWKWLRRLLRMREMKAGSPIMAFRQAYHEGWINDKPLFEKMIEDRNTVTHEYFEEKALEIYGRLPSYLKIMQALAREIQIIYDQEPQGL